MPNKQMTLPQLQVYRSQNRFKEFSSLGAGKARDPGAGISKPPRNGLYYPQFYLQEFLKQNRAIPLELL